MLNKGWKEIALKDIPKSKRDIKKGSVYVIRDFLASGKDAAEIDISLYANVVSAKACFDQARTKYFKGMVMVVKRDNRIFLIRKYGGNNNAE
jgi:hypothetical protein